MEKLGHGAENGLWRNIYLRGAEELRGPIAPPPPELASPEVLGALTIEQLFDSLGSGWTGSGPHWPPPASTGCSPTSTGPTAPSCRTGRSSIPIAGYGMGEPTLTVTLRKPQLIGVIATGKLDSVSHDGDAGVIGTLLGLVDSVDHRFPIVTP